MNEVLMRPAGFGKEIDSIKKGKCPFCGHEIVSYTEFRDRLSIEEFHISGLCQKCQDKVFGK